MINLSRDKYWAIIYTILTTGVYFACETLQLSPLISEDSHYKTTVYTFSYDLLYSWFISYILIKTSNIIIDDYPSNTIIYQYTLAYYFGAIGFALLGEIPCLHDLVIVPHFWEHLKLCTKITILLFAIGIIILGIYQLKQAIKDKDLQKHFLPYVIFTSFYGIILGTLIGGKASNVNIHVHHAICASLLSLWFTDWNNKSSMMLHGMLMGVAIEGINFYGIGELSLFLCNNGSMMVLSYMIPIMIIWLMISVVLIYNISYYMRKQIKPPVVLELFESNDNTTRFLENQ